MRRAAFIALLFATSEFSYDSATAQNDSPFDLVITGGRVIDPETGLDGVRNVGIRDGRITEISTDDLDAAETIDAAGLVVAPGFIDLHAHGQDAPSALLQAADGVTTALELEIGVFPVAPWYESKRGKSIINYGATVGHVPARVKVMHGIDAGHLPTIALDERAKFADGDYARRAATDDEIEQIAALVEQGLDDGALGIGFGLAYTPKASHREVLRAFEVAGASGAPCFVHMRSADTFSDAEAIGPLQELIANSAATGASLHVVHLNSSAGKLARISLDAIRNARRRGLDITTEVYPYTASSTTIQAPFFDGDWEARSGLSYSDMIWVETGERLTKETFEKYRPHGGWVIVHGMSEEIIGWLVAQPDVIIASDGVPFVDGRAHPRGAGTFSRVLGRYVREQQTLSLVEALAKMTILPAQRLETSVPQMKRKGRVQVGADADLTLFDPKRVLDRATYTEPAQTSAGITHVLVGGTFVVRDGVVQDEATPGKAVRRGA